MIEEPVKSRRNTEKVFDFSIVIPSWNNLDYLKLCISSILKNSSLSFQIIVIINEGKDGTKEWVEENEQLDYVYSAFNIGICYGLNISRSLLKSDYILYINDDMYVLPGWDTHLKKEIEKIGHNRFMISSTLIEPFDTGNSCVVVKDFGQDLGSFKEAELLLEYQNLAIADWNGSTWPPNIVHVDLWDMVGGLSIEFSPGMYSDPDFSRKLYEVGVRHFIGKGSSLVYHFGSKSTKRIRKNKGRKTFLTKWGITSNTFSREYLNIGKPFKELPKNHTLKASQKLINRIKRALTAF